MRCVSLSVGNSIFSIGGHTKEKTPSKEVWIFERSYNTMRVVCLLKKGRVGHTVCYEDDKVYIFGGKGVDSL